MYIKLSRGDKCNKFCLKKFSANSYFYSKVETFYFRAADSSNLSEIKWKFKLWARKFAWAIKAKHCWAIVDKLFVFKTPSNVLPLQKAAAIQMLMTWWRIIRSNQLSLLKFSQLYLKLETP